MFSMKNKTIMKPEQYAIDIVEKPSETISCIIFSKDSTKMAVGSWDGAVRIYRKEVYISQYKSYNSSQPTNPYKLERTIQVEKPCLSIIFLENSRIIAGLNEGTLCLLDELGNVQSMQAHNAGIKMIETYNNQYLITGSFDSTMKIWDINGFSLIQTINLPGKVYAGKLASNILFLGLSCQKVYIYTLPDLDNPSIYDYQSNYSMRSISSVQNDISVFAIGGVAGKVDIVSRNDYKKVSMRIQRVQDHVHACNHVAFFPNNTRIVVACGSNGSIDFIDRITRSKLYRMEYLSSVTAMCISPDGNYIVFSLGDDWSKGYTGKPVKTELKVIEVNLIPQIKGKTTMSR